MFLFLKDILQEVEEKELEEYDDGIDVIISRLMFSCSINSKLSLDNKSDSFALSYSEKISGVEIPRINIT